MNSFKKWPRLIVAGVGTCLLVMLCFVSLLGALGGVKVKADRPSLKSAKVSQQDSVCALGRLEPKGGIIKISAPAFLKDERVAAIFVRQGDKVRKGQLLCVLEGYDRLLASLEEARKHADACAARLERVKAGVQTAEVDAQKSKIKMLESDMSNQLSEQQAIIDRCRHTCTFDDLELGRYLQLLREGAISASLADQKGLASATSKAKLAEMTAEKSRLQETFTARLTHERFVLAKIAEVRQVDVAVALADLKEAESRAARIAKDLEYTSIRAPMNGRLLKLNARLDEAITEKGIAEFGNTETMVAVAEVYQSDISKVRIGQVAIITSEALPGQLKGKVERIDRQIVRQHIFGQEPSANSDRRVVEVTVLLDENATEQASSLTNLQVQVRLAT